MSYRHRYTHGHPAMRYTRTRSKLELKDEEDMFILARTRWRWHGRLEKAAKTEHLYRNAYNIQEKDHVPSVDAYSKASMESCIGSGGVESEGAIWGTTHGLTTVGRWLQLLVKLGTSPRASNSTRNPGTTVAHPGSQGQLLLEDCLSAMREQTIKWVSPLGFFSFFFSRCSAHCFSPVVATDPDLVLMDDDGDAADDDQPRGKQPL